MPPTRAPAVPATPTTTTTPPASAAMSSPLGAPFTSEIAFFDVETTIPSRAGQGYSLLEFGAILVCPRTLVEVDSYATLIRPADVSCISASSVRCNGITREAIETAPTFAEVADRIYGILHGRVWAGHNILRFDRARIREAFEEISRPAPEPTGTIDSLPLLTQKFGRRAGNMKMATLAQYFNLGQQKHRSLDDVRMNLEVLKYCATVLFLESSMLETSSVSGWRTTHTTRDVGPSVSRVNASAASYLNFNNHEEIRGTDNVMEIGGCDMRERGLLGQGMDSFVPVSLIEEMEAVSLQAESDVKEGCSNNSTFLEPDGISKEHISTYYVPTNQRGCKTVLLHRGLPLQICCRELRVRFGINRKFCDYAGRPKSSIVVDAPQNLCQVLDICDDCTQRSLQSHGSCSEWRPSVTKIALTDLWTVRLRIPIASSGSSTHYVTELYQKDSCGNTRKLHFNEENASDLDQLLVPGTSVDAYFCVETYDYQQNAGNRLVAQQLIIHS